jgi:hypothetical protein
MGYNIQCRSCKRSTWAHNIVQLLKKHTDDRCGRFTCSHCHGVDTYIYRESKLQEQDEVWKRWIKGVICIDAQSETYFPYVFLTSQREDGPIEGLHFHYYKDTREQGGRLKHGHGPGGPPVLRIDDVFVILKRLVSQGVISSESVKEFADGL